MSQIISYDNSVVKTLTGNAGGAISPTSGNIDILGAAGFLTVTGTLVAPTSTLTISDNGTVATSFVTDAGIAAPVGNILNVLGGANLNTVGAANNVTINLNDNIKITSMTTDDAASGLNIIGDVIAANGTDADIDIVLEPQGAGSVIVADLSFNNTTISSATDITLVPTGNVIVSSGTPYAVAYFGAGNKLSSLGPLTNGQIVVGSTAAIPVAANLTSADATIDFTVGAGTLDLIVGTSVATTFTGDVGSAIPVANNLNIVGTAGITTAAAGGTVTISGNGSSTYTYTPVAASPYVVLDTDNVISVDCSGGLIEILLPDAASLGQVFRIKDRTGSANTNNITVTTPSAVATIDGAVSFVMNADYESITVIGNAASYEVL